MSTERILDKVRKLLALANNAGATEGERDNAVRQAHAMLAKYNLAMADVTLLEQVEGREEVGLQTYGMKWCRLVADAIAQMFFCKSYFYTNQINGTKRQYFFVGKQSNAITASLMTEYLIKSILKECRARYGHNLAPASRAFATGAADKLWQRVQKIVATGGPDAEPGTVLVLVDMYRSEALANQAFMDNAGTELVKFGKRGAPVGGTAYRDGVAFGDNLSLNNQVAHSHRKQIGNNS